MARSDVRKRKTKLLVARKFAVFCVLLAMAFAAVITYYEAERPAAEQAREPLPMLPKGAMELGGTPVSTLSKAEVLVGYDVATPRSLPSGYSLAGIRVDATSVTLTLMYSNQGVSSELPPTIDMLAFLNQGYWFFQQGPADRGVDPVAIVNAAVKDGFTQAITINGAPGFITCAANASSLEWWSEDGTYHKFLYSCIHWWSQGKHYVLIAPTSTTCFQMIEFAESVSL